MGVEITTKVKKKKGFLEGYKTYDTTGGFGSVEDWKKAFEKRFNFKVISVEEKATNVSILQPLYDATDFFMLRKAYRELMMQYHPDKAGDSEENKTIAQMLNDTYFELKEKF
jgi:hypothetical protein